MSAQTATDRGSMVATAMSHPTRVQILMAMNTPPQRMSPKMFARLTRFSKAYRLRERDVALTWTDIAYRCGYYDQMHFIKDFKFFAGVTPSIMEDTLHNTSVRLQKDLRL